MRERWIALERDYLRRHDHEQRKGLTVVSLDSPPRPSACPSGRLAGLVDVRIC
jgi:hypothetical protein